MLAHPRKIAQKIPSGNKSTHPEYAARDVVDKKSARVHQGNTRYKGGKCAHNGDEAGKYNSFSAVAL